MRYVNHAGIKDIVPVLKYLNRKMNESTSATMNFDGQIQQYNTSSELSEKQELVEIAATKSIAFLSLS